MKNSMLLILLTLISCKQSIDYSGSWVSSGDNFENTLILEKIEGEQDSYKFSFNAWRKSYDTYASQDVKFLGRMNNKVFVINVKDKQAVYSDDVREFSEEFPLYNDGEERCKVYFKFDEDSIKVNTKACSLIYVGFGITFDGIYLK
jgi:hypothetical protein